MVSTIFSKNHLIQFLFKTVTHMLKQKFVSISVLYYTTQYGFWTYIEHMLSEGFYAKNHVSGWLSLNFFQPNTDLNIQYTWSACQKRYK